MQVARVLPMSKDNVLYIWMEEPTLSLCRFICIHYFVADINTGWDAHVFQSINPKCHQKGNPFMVVSNIHGCT